MIKEIFVYPFMPVLVRIIIALCSFPSALLATVFGCPSTRVNETNVPHAWDY